MLTKLSTLVAAGAFVALLAPAANALPLAPLSSDAGVILVAQGCGPGFHRGPAGRCRPNLVGRSHCRWIRTAYGPRRVCR